MTWLAVDKDGTETIYAEEPIKRKEYGEWDVKRFPENCSFIDLPKGSIKKLIGRELTWEDEPIKLE